MAQFSGKVVIVTGGAQGIGRSCCIHFAEEGAHVVCGDVDLDAGKELVAEWQQRTSQGPTNKNELEHRNYRKCVESGTMTFVHFDASSSADCHNLVTVATKITGDIDVLFNNVGIQPKQSNVPIHKLEEAAWDAVFNINIKSFYLMCKHAIPVMLQHPDKRHSIINNSSIQGIQSQKGVPAYAATKGAILSLTRQLAVEYGSSNITVNAVSPGSIATPLALANNKSFEFIAKNTPLGKIGEPRDVAEIVLFLASESAKWVTGQNFVVDGGITVKGGWAPLSDDLF